MPKSTRRETMAAVAAACFLPLAVTTRAAAAPPSQDAELIRLCRLMIANRADQDEMQAIYGELHPDAPSYPMLHARICRLDAENAALAPRIAAIPAATLGGIKARAAALQAFAPVDHDNGSLMLVNWDRGMLAALLSDLAGDVA